MNTIPNANNEFKEAFSALFSKPGSPFQGANITIENLIIHMPVESTVVKAGDTKATFPLEQTPDSVSTPAMVGQILDVNATDIFVYSPLGKKLDERLLDFSKYLFWGWLEAPSIVVGSTLSVIYNSGPTSRAGKQWVKTTESTWTPVKRSTSSESVKVTVETEPAVNRPDVANLVMQIKEEPAAVPEANLSSDSLAKQVAELNAADIVITLPSGRKLCERKIDIDSSLFNLWLDSQYILIGSVLSITFNTGHASKASKRWLKTSLSTWLPIEGKEDYQADVSIKAMMYMIEGFDKVSLEAITPAGHRQGPEYVEGYSCFSLKEIDEFEIGTQICARVADKDGTQMVKYLWWKVTKVRWDRLPDCTIKQTTKNDQNNATSYYSSSDVKYQIKERLAIAKSYKGLEVLRIDLVYPESKTSTLLESGQFATDELEATPTGTKIILTGATRAGVNRLNGIRITWSKQTNDLWDKQVTYELFSDWYMPLNSKEISTFELTESINNINDISVEVFVSHEPHISRSKLDFDENKRIKFFEFPQWYMIGTMIIVKSKSLTQSWIRKTNQGWTKLPDSLLQGTNSAVENLTTQMVTERDADRQSTANFDCKPLIETITTDKLCLLLIKMPVSPVVIYSKDEKLRSTFSTYCQDLLWLLNTSESGSVLVVTVFSKKGTCISNYNYRKESSSQWSQIKAVPPSKH